MSLLDNANWLEVHVRFVQGDLLSGEELVAYFLPWLSRRLRHYWTDVDEQWIAESVEDALLAYLNDPQRFDATRGTSLAYWLSLQACGYLANVRRKELNHRRHERTVGVEGQIFEKNARIVSRKESWDDYLSIGGEVQANCSVEGSWLTALFSPQEQGELELLVRRAPREEWVHLLCLKGLPEAEQQQRVSREKERLRKKRLRIRSRRRGVSDPCGQLPNSCREKGGDSCRVQ